MHRYLVERTFRDDLTIPASAAGAQACLGIVDQNLAHDVSWITSYVTPDRTRTFCIYDGPSPEAIRLAAGANGWPVDAITEVTVLDPYFYRSTS